MKNVYLTGFMGTGKTTLGEILSRKLGREFVEMDRVIEAREGKKITDIFAERGERYFRNREQEFLKELAAKTDLVVSCGGGLICHPGNLTLLKASGRIFSLKASSSTIYERIKKYTHRPLLNVVDPLKRIEELLVKREPYYQQADYAINTEQISPQEAADKIIAILKAEKTVA